MGSFLWASRNEYILYDCQIQAGDAQLYSSARLSPISLKYYGFCLKSGVYDVKLHFAEISSSENKVSHSKAGRLFDVDIQGENVLRNFNIEKDAGGVNMAITKEFTCVLNNSLEIHLYWSGKGSVLYRSEYYGPLISAITLELVELYPGGLYNYQKIKAATKNFDTANRIGEGGFGTVYKGTLSNGIAVAVKKLSRTKEGMWEFVEKSRAIAGMKHPNLVTLMGCCLGNNQLLLIYEYIGTNTLEDALFGHTQRQKLKIAP
ncbi:putative LRR receptor-like serine/threonine-protein kinase-like isoform X2 [Capsicum annuum]|nr:putative LRR receptor-like serine/threonine-protein kinase-like isoform X2 [Capsicum annuum]